MAAKKAAKAGDSARAAANNAYVQRLIQDEELRDNLRTAYDSARGAYGRLANGKAPTKALMQDKKLQKDLKTAAQALNEASGALREAPKKSRPSGGGSLGKLLLLAIIGAAVAVGASESLRSKVLDALFGSEEEFDYTSTTSPPVPAPPQAPAPTTS